MNASDIHAEQRAKLFDEAFPEDPATPYVNLKAFADWTGDKHTSLVEMHRRDRFPRLYHPRHGVWRVLRSDLRRWFLLQWDATDEERQQQNLDDLAASYRLDPFPESSQPVAR